MVGVIQKYVSLFAGSLLSLSSQLQEYSGELDFPSLYNSQINNLLFPVTYPRNETNDIAMWRDIFNARSSENITSYGIGVTDVWLDGFGSSEKQLMRIFNSNITDPGALPERDVLLWFHDGAWMFGGAEHEDEICYKLAKSTGFIVVSAAYRLAPEYPFPQPVNDATNSLLWINSNIKSFGAHPKKIMIGGEGAGANLAAAVALRNLDIKLVRFVDRVSVIGLLLIYPPLEMFSYGGENSSYSLYGDINRLMSAEQLDWAKSMYRGTSTVKPNDYTFAPLVASPNLLKLLPNTVIVLAKHCILHDEGIKFGQILKTRYVPVETLVYNSTVYGFFGRSIFPQGDIALNHTSQKLRKISETYSASYFVDEKDFGGSLPPFPNKS